MQQLHRAALPGVKAFFTDVFELPLPDRHKFPMSKYRLLRERLEADGTVELLVPPAATDDQLALAHDRDYIAAVVAGTLPIAQVRRLGFPWSPQLVERSRRSTGATVAALRTALDEGVAANLAGGTHHAFRDRPEGYCVFNDAAVALRLMQREGRMRTGVVIDCDVHQGNGTAAILAGDDSLFTFSIHGGKNFPFHKESSDLDVPLPDDTADDDYLAALTAALAQVFDRCTPDAAVYVAGADPYEHDRLGRLALTKPGLASRDRRVLDACASRRLPVAVVMAGGYAPDVADIVDIHHRTVTLAAETQRRYSQ